MTPPLLRCHAPGPRLSSVVSSLLGQRSQIHATLEATECHVGCTRLQQEQGSVTAGKGNEARPESREPQRPADEARTEQIGRAHV